MRKTVFLVILLLLAGWVTAQTLIPIPAETTTYKSTRMRGLWFTAPIDFTIRELKVPDPQHATTQHVLVFKPVGTLPAYPSSTYTPPIFYASAKAGVKIACDIPVNKGAMVGVLGGYGDSTQTINSYGSGTPYATTILGTPVSLNRFITQTNVPSNKGVKALYSGSTGSLGRVEVYVVKGAGANITPTGTGDVGTTVKLLLTSTADAGRGYQVGTSLGKGPISIDSRKLYLSPDILLVLSVGGLAPSIFQGYAGTLDAQGQATAAIVLPNIPALKGIMVYTSFATLLGSAPSGISDLSPEWGLTIS